MSEPTQRDDQLHIFNERYSLKRYPAQHQKELRAWDTADLYLLRELSVVSPEVKHLAIINDKFGALTLPLSALNPLCYGDSWMSRRATELNLKLNRLDAPWVFEESLDQLSAHHPPPHYVIGRVPKSTSQLIHILRTLNQWLDEGAVLMLAGMDKHLSRGQYQQLAKHFGPSRYLPGVQKARVWVAQCDKSLARAPHTSPELSIPDYQLRLTASPNVFSHDKVDIGSRFFLDHLSQVPIRERVADMACGYGVLGLAYLSRVPHAQMILCDESFQAVRSTQINLSRNAPHAQARVYADDGLKRLAPSSLDLVLCNPPFHQHHTVSTDIAHALFRDAERALSAGGELWIVANRHLSYHLILKKLFKECSVEASSSKFCILRSIKR